VLLLLLPLEREIVAAVHRRNDEMLLELQFSALYLGSKAFGAQ